MKTATVAKQIETAARGYKTQAACLAAITRITRLWQSEGAYGCYKHEVEQAVWECRIRWQEIAGEKRDALAAV